MLRGFNFKQCGSDRKIAYISKTSSMIVYNYIIDYDIIIAKLKPITNNIIIKDILE
jgi:hypothetical protein